MMLTHRGTNITIAERVAAWRGRTRAQAQIMLARCCEFISLLAVMVTAARKNVGW
jgi:hypothetical protein